MKKTHRSAGLKSVSNLYHPFKLSNFQIPLFSAELYGLPIEGPACDCLPPPVIKVLARKSRRLLQLQVAVTIVG